jgi:hypothetical protein
MGDGNGDDTTMSLPQPLVALLNKVDTPGHRVMMFMVPLRIVRVISTDDTFMTFRVEQLVITGKNPMDPRGTWTTLSTHSGQVAGAAYQNACKAGIEAQADLTRKLERQMAQTQMMP